MRDPILVKYSLEACVFFLLKISSLPKVWNIKICFFFEILTVEGIPKSTTGGSRCLS